MNIKNSGEELEKLVGEIMSRKVTSMPFDFQFGKSMGQYPEINHDELGLSGKFKNKEDPRIFVPDDGMLEMDYLESVISDGEKILREAEIDVEQETGFVKYDKKQIIFEYCLYAIMDLKKPCYPYVVTNYEYCEDFIEYYIEDLSIKVNWIRREYTNS